MCRSMVDIQSATAEIRRRKKIERKKERQKPQGKNIMSASATQGGHNKSQRELRHSHERTVYYSQNWTWVAFLKPNPKQNFCTQRNLRKFLPDRTRPITDTRQFGKPISQQVRVGRKQDIYCTSCLKRT